MSAELATLHFALGAFMNDFCFCELSPVLVGLGVCLTTTAIGLATWLFWSKRQQNKRFPLHTLYPGWAFVSGASSGVGRKVRTLLHMRIVLYHN